MGAVRAAAPDGAASLGHHHRFTGDRRGHRRRAGHPASSGCAARAECVGAGVAGGGAMRGLAGRHERGSASVLVVGAVGAVVMVLSAVLVVVGAVRDLHRVQAAADLAALAAAGGTSTGDRPDCRAALSVAEANGVRLTRCATEPDGSVVVTDGRAPAVAARVAAADDDLRASSGRCGRCRRPARNAGLVVSQDSSPRRGPGGPRDRSGSTVGQSRRWSGGAVGQAWRWSGRASVRPGGRRAGWHPRAVAASCRSPSRCARCHRRQRCRPRWEPGAGR